MPDRTSPRPRPPSAAGCHTGTSHGAGAIRAREHPLGRARVVTRSRPMHRDDVHPPIAAVREAVAIALAEDLLPLGDLSASLLPASLPRPRHLRRPVGRACVAGTRCAEETCIQVDPELEVTWALCDGEEVGAGRVIGRIEGPYRSLLTAERTALNFLCHLSGRRDGDAALRRGRPRRQSFDEDLGHAQDDAGPAGARESGRAGRRRRQPPRQPLRGCADQGQPPRRPFDRRGRPQGARTMARSHGRGRVRPARPGGRGARCRGDARHVRQHDPRGRRARAFSSCAPIPRGATGAVLVEASGGISLDNVADYARAGADVISVGALTHSVVALDIGLDLRGA